MKLLFDNNISPKLVERLADVFPECSHVVLLGLDQSSDTVVWNTAQQHGYTLVSKDADFNELLTIKGFPPKVIWIRLGNCTTNQIYQVLLKYKDVIIEFEKDKTMGLLEIF